MITTWADGYGIWHARVPEGPSSANVARRAILAELRLRESREQPVVPSRVEVIPDLLAAEIAGTVVYKER